MSDRHTASGVFNCVIGISAYQIVPSRRCKIDPENQNFSVSVSDHCTSHTATRSFRCTGQQRASAWLRGTASFKEVMHVVHACRSTSPRSRCSWLNSQTPTSERRNRTSHLITVSDYELAAILRYYLRYYLRIICGIIYLSLLYRRMDLCIAMYRISCILSLSADTFQNYSLLAQPTVPEFSILSSV